jgi:hypothetical protein
VRATRSADVFRDSRPISNIETFAAGSGIREIARLRRVYGRGRWRKRKGIARVRLADGTIHSAEVHGTRPPDSGGKNLRSSTCFEIETMAKTQAKQLVVCVDNKDYRASLEKRKIYVTLRDADAEKSGLIRVIDESGEDYLYPKSSFRLIALPLAVKKAVLAA